MRMRKAVPSCLAERIAPTTLTTWVRIKDRFDEAHLPNANFTRRLIFETFTFVQKHTCIIF